MHKLLIGIIVVLVILHIYTYTGKTYNNRSHIIPSVWAMVVYKYLTGSLYRI